MRRSCLARRRSAFACACAAATAAALAILAAFAPPARAFPAGPFSFWNARDLADSLAPVPRAAPAALSVVVGRPTWNGRDLVVPVRVAHPIAPALRQLLKRGVPATCDVTVELWNARAGWFDRRVVRRSVAYRVRYDLWRDRWMVRAPGGAEIAVRDTGEVDRALSAWQDVRLARPGRLSRARTYYAVARVRVGPLSNEDVTEMEGWLAGDGVDSTETAGNGGAAHRHHPMRGVSDFGVARATARTPVFRPAVEAAQ